MKNKVKIYDLKDPLQYEVEKNFWNNASIEFKLNALEEIRASYIKLFKVNKDEVSKRLRRVYRVTEQKQG
ncbi:MAG: hypothetical protein P8X47_02725 [Ignavibacteriaceae bacterium]|jgi:hypothetical protein